MRSQAPGSARGYDYELLDALIVGACDALNQQNHRIANLFALGHAQSSPRDLLIGPHSLFLLAQGVHRHRALSDTLLALGHNRGRIDATLAALSAFNVLHQVPTQDDSLEYELHLPVIREYVGGERPGLLWEPAYLDNVAMVTPLDPGLLCRTQRTRGDRADDFIPRVLTSLAFLRFLRDCEESFCDRRKLPLGVDPGGFATALDHHRIPCLWRGMTIAYQDRLTGLRRSGYLKNVAADWWDGVLNDPVFRDARHAPTHLAARPP